MLGQQMMIAARNISSEYADLATGAQLALAGSAITVARSFKGVIGYDTQMLRDAGYKTISFICSSCPYNHPIPGSQAHQCCRNVISDCANSLVSSGHFWDSLRCIFKQADFWWSESRCSPYPPYACLSTGLTLLHRSSFPKSIRWPLEYLFQDVQLGCLPAMYKSHSMWSSADTLIITLSHGRISGNGTAISKYMIWGQCCSCLKLFELTWLILSYRNHLRLLQASADGLRNANMMSLAIKWIIGTAEISHAMAILSGRDLALYQAMSFSSTFQTDCLLTVSRQLRQPMSSYREVQPKMMHTP